MENVALLAEEEITQCRAPGQDPPGVTEGLGIMFLASRMNGLFERYPGLEVELVGAALRQHPQPRGGISIHLERPSADMLVTRKLTDYRLALYASRPTWIVTADSQARRPGGMPGSVTSTTCCSARN
jgi:DNA-binding transcriptional LysR family regulator